MLSIEQGGVRSRLSVAVTLVVIVAASVVTAAVRAPFRDEAWFASPALSLLDGGTTGTSLLTERSGEGFLNGRKLTRIDQVTYWSMPLHFVSLAAWCAVAGFGLLQVRLHSLLWALVALWGLIQISRSLGPASPPRWLVLLICGLDFMFITMSAHGRMEMMCLGLWVAALGVLVSGPQSRGRLLLSGLLVACSIVTHPVGVLGGAGIVLAMMVGVTPRPANRQLLYLVTPVIVLVVLWLGYGSLDPEAFRDQLAANSSNRLSNLGDPVSALRRELTVRYLSAYGFTPDAPRLQSISALPLVLYVGALIWGCVSAFRGDRRLFWLSSLAIVAILFLTYFDHRKLSFYIVHVNVLLGLLTAAMLSSVSRLGARHRRAALVAACGVAMVHLAPTAGRAMTNPRAPYERLRAALKSETPVSPVYAHAEYAFVAGFDGLLDDEWIGWKTGPRPGLILASPALAGEIARRRTTIPGFDAYATELFRDARIRHVEGVALIWPMAIEARSRDRQRAGSGTSDE